MRRTVTTIILLALSLPLIGILLDRRGMQEYWLYLAEDRPRLDLKFTDISQEWTEPALRAAFPGLRFNCYNNAPGEYLDERSCFADIASHNGAAAMAVAFHLDKGKVNHVAVQIPSWAHGSMRDSLARQYGPPQAAQREPIAGNRLIGWKLGGNGSIFANRDRPRSPLAINQVLWSSDRQCSRQPCWRDDQAGR